MALPDPCRAATCGCRRRRPCRMTCGRHAPPRASSLARSLADVGHPRKSVAWRWDPLHHLVGANGFFAEVLGEESAAQRSAIEVEQVDGKGRRSTPLRRINLCFQGAGDGWRLLFAFVLNAISSPVAGEEIGDLDRRVLNNRTVHRVRVDLSAKSARIVPRRPSFGLVAPISSRFFSTAFRLPAPGPSPGRRS